MRLILACILMSLGSQSLAQVSPPPASNAGASVIQPKQKVPDYIARRQTARVAQQKAVQEKAQKSAAERARAVAYSRFLATGVLPADPAEAQTILRLHEVRLKQAEIQAKIQAAQPKGEWVIGIDPRTGRQFNYFLTDEERRRSERETDRVSKSMQQMRSTSGTIRPDGAGGYNVEFQTFPY